MKVRIERLGHRGDGIAPGPVFVPLVLPGEVVEGEISGDRMAEPRIVTPSANRVKAPCSHFRSCGGCSLQHGSDEFVADWKVGVVRTALEARGIEAEIVGIKTSPAGSRRRAILSARRTKKGALVGFHARSSETIVEIPGCILLDPAIVNLLPMIEELVMLGGSRKGEMSIAVTVTENGPDISVRGGKPLDGPLRIALAAKLEAHQLSRLSWSGEPVAERAPPVQRFGAALVAPPAGAFLQATAQGESALLDAMTRASAGAKRIVDLFAGCGTFSLPLAARAEVHAVEGEADMLAALDRGWRMAQGLKAVTTETRDLFRRPLMPDELKRFDCAVIDPPRAGAEAQVDELGQSDIARVGFVSCNPVTFARDAQTLIGAGFRLDWVEVVDQFRWSPHVELAAQFTR